MSELTVAFWLYPDPAPLTRGPRNYSAAHVNAQLPMLARHMPEHRVVVITDDTDGLDPSVEVFPSPVKDDGPDSLRDRRYPSCMRRIWNFSDAARALGSRVFFGDLDSMYVRDMRPLVERPEPLVVWRAPSGIILGGGYLLSTGTHTHVWDSLDLSTAMQTLARARLQTSDQGWLNYTLPLSTPAWREADGAYLPGLARNDLPDTARLVSFGGPDKPWSQRAQDRFDWITRHYEVPT